MQNVKCYTIIGGIQSSRLGIVYTRSGNTTTHNKHQPISSATCLLWVDSFIPLRYNTWNHCRLYPQIAKLSSLQHPLIAKLTKLSSSIFIKNVLFHQDSSKITYFNLVKNSTLFPLEQWSHNYKKLTCSWKHTLQHHVKWWPFACNHHLLFNFIDFYSTLLHFAQEHIHWTWRAKRKQNLIFEI